MNYSDLKNIVLEIYQILGRIDTEWENSDLLGLEKSKSELTRLSVPLAEVYFESNKLYIQAKEHLDCRKAEIYRDSRQTMNVEDSRNEARLQTISQLQEMNRQKCRRDKSRGLREQVTEVIIDLSIKIRNLKDNEKYG